MRNQGQITVFLSLILISLLVLFLAAIGVVEFHMDRARVSEAAKGASEHIKADYQEQIFEEYHVLLLDKTYAGRGEGALEDRMLRYLDYTQSYRNEICDGFTLCAAKRADPRLYDFVFTGKGSKGYWRMDAVG